MPISMNTRLQSIPKGARLGHILACLLGFCLL